MKCFPVIALIFLCGCFSRPLSMTQENFDNIQLGSTITEVRSHAGTPYSVHRKGPDKVEYEYIERFDLGQNFIYENHYYLLVIDGKVVKKRIKQERPPSFDFMYSDDPNIFNEY